MIKWKYSNKFWKYNTDIFNDKKDLLTYSKGYVNNYRKYYSISSKQQLYKKIYKDYLNIIMNKVSEGNIIVLTKSINIYLKDKYAYESPYEDILDKLAAKNKLAYIYLNTGEMLVQNKDFMIIPSKTIKDKLLDLKKSGKNYTKLISNYIK